MGKRVQPQTQTKKTVKMAPSDFVSASSGTSRAQVDHEWIAKPKSAQGALVTGRRNTIKTIRKVFGSSRNYQTEYPAM